MHKLRRMMLSASTTAWLVMFKVLFDWHFGILGIIAVALIVYPATMLIRKPTDQIVEACCVQRNSDTKFATFPVMMAVIAIGIQTTSALIFACVWFWLLMYLTDFWIVNPTWLFLGCWVYNVTTNNGVTRTLIIRGAEVQFDNQLDNVQLFRITDEFYFGKQ